jgi:hypothetical protein
MTGDTKDQNRTPSGEAEGRPAHDHAHVEALREQTSAAAPDPGSAHSAMRLRRRGALGSMAGVVGGRVLVGLGPVRSAEADIPTYPVPDDPTKVPGRPASAYGFRSQFETAARWPAP